MVNTPPEPDTTRCEVCGRSLSEKTAKIRQKAGCIFCKGVDGE